MTQALQGQPSAARPQPGEAPPASPWLSVIVPCRNERDHIEALCSAVLAQRCPPGWRVEVLIADGRSDDGTREWLQDFCAAPRHDDVSFVLLDNERRSTPCGLNVCIAHARGQVLVRWDVHTVYDSDYLVQCMAVLQATGADNVGGPWKAEGVTPMQRAIAAAFQSRWVAGGARSRDLSYEGEVDTVYLGCWPRSTFERFGGFDESLMRNQDDEHNLRLSRGGARIWQSARIRSTYAPRAHLGQLRRQYLQYGYWKPFVMKKHGQPASWRHLIPGLFVASWIALGVIAALVGLLGSGVSTRVAIAAWSGLSLAYLSCVLGLTLLVSSSVRGGGAWGVALRVPAVIVVYHLSYGWGFLRGGLDAWARGQVDPSFGRLSR